MQNKGLFLEFKNNVTIKNLIISDIIPGKLLLFFVRIEGNNAEYIGISSINIDSTDFY